MNYHDIDEEVLFKPEVKNDSVEDLSFDFHDTDVSEEVLFSNSQSEFLEFLEPTMPEVAKEVSSVETLDVIQDIETDVSEETLFGNDTMLEDIEVKDETSIVEENIDFAEPTQGEFVNEEVLFTPQVEEVSLDADGDSAVPDELSAISDIEEVTLFDNEKPVYIERNFAKKMLESDPLIIARYEELKNYLLTFKKVKSRISNDFDSFNMGRTQLAKLGVSQKSLKLYLNLEFETVESRLKCKFAGDKKAYASVPVFLRIKSDRAMRNAKYLIDKLAVRFELSQNLKATKVNAAEMLEGKAKSYE